MPQSGEQIRGQFRTKNGEMQHWHMGYPPSATGPSECKWHNVSQKHREDSQDVTEEIHEKSGMGKDGMGGTPVMRAQASAVSSGKGAMSSPSVFGTKMDDAYAASPTLARSMATLGRLGKLTAAGSDFALGSVNTGLKLASKLFSSALSGRPMSAAADAVTSSLGAGLSVYDNNILGLSQRYGIKPGGDPGILSGTLKGRIYQSKVNSVERGSADAISNASNDVRQIMGRDGDISEMTPEELLTYMEAIQLRGDNAYNQFKSGKNDQGEPLTAKDSLRLKSEMDTYGKIMDEVADKCTENEELNKVLLSEISWDRTYNSERTRLDKKKELEDHIRLMTTDEDGSSNPVGKMMVDRGHTGYKWDHCHIKMRDGSIISMGMPTGSLSSLSTIRGHVSAAISELEMKDKSKTPLTLMEEHNLKYFKKWMSASNILKEQMEGTKAALRSDDKAQIYANAPISERLAMDYNIKLNDVDIGGKIASVPTKREDCNSYLNVLNQEEGEAQSRLKNYKDNAKFKDGSTTFKEYGRPYSKGDPTVPHYDRDIASLNNINIPDSIANSLRERIGEYDEYKDILAKRGDDIQVIQDSVANVMKQRDLLFNKEANKRGFTSDAQKYTFNLGVTKQLPNSGVPVDKQARRRVYNSLVEMSKKQPLSPELQTLKDNINKMDEWDDAISENVKSDNIGVYDHVKGEVDSDGVPTTTRDNLKSLDNYVSNLERQAISNGLAHLDTDGNVIWDSKDNDTYANWVIGDHIRNMTRAKHDAKSILTYKSNLKWNDESAREVGFDGLADMNAQYYALNRKENEIYEKNRELMSAKPSGKLASPLQDRANEIANYYSLNKQDIEDHLAQRERFIRQIRGDPIPVSSTQNDQIAENVENEDIGVFKYLAGDKDIKLDKRGIPAPSLVSMVDVNNYLNDIENEAKNSKYATISGKNNALVTWNDTNNKLYPNWKVGKFVQGVMRLRDDERSILNLSKNTNWSEIEAKKFFGKDGKQAIEREVDDIDRRRKEFIDGFTDVMLRKYPNTTPEESLKQRSRDISNFISKNYNKMMQFDKDQNELIRKLRKVSDAPKNGGAGPKSGKNNKIVLSGKKGATNNTQVINPVPQNNGTNGAITAKTPTTVILQGGAKRTVTPFTPLIGDHTDDNKDFEDILQDNFKNVTDLKEISELSSENIQNIKNTVDKLDKAIEIEENGVTTDRPAKRLKYGLINGLVGNLESELCNRDDYRDLLFKSIKYLGPKNINSRLTNSTESRQNSLKVTPGTKISPFDFTNDLNKEKIEALDEIYDKISTAGDIKNLDMSEIADPLSKLIIMDLSKATKKNGKLIPLSDTIRTNLSNFENLKKIDEADDADEDNPAVDSEPATDPDSAPATSPDTPPVSPPDALPDAKPTQTPDKAPDALPDASGVLPTEDAVEADEEPEQVVEADEAIEDPLKRQAKDISDTYSAHSKNVEDELKSGKKLDRNLLETQETELKNNTIQFLKDCFDSDDSDGSIEKMLPLVPSKNAKRRTHEKYIESVGNVVQDAIAIRALANSGVDVNLNLYRKLPDNIKEQIRADIKEGISGEEYDDIFDSERVKDIFSDNGIWVDEHWADNPENLENATPLDIMEYMYAPNSIYDPNVLIENRRKTVNDVKAALKAHGYEKSANKLGSENNFELKRAKKAVSEMAAAKVMIDHFEDMGQDFKSNDFLALSKPSKKIMEKKIIDRLENNGFEDDFDEEFFKTIPIEGNGTFDVNNEVGIRNTGKVIKNWIKNYADAAFEKKNFQESEREEISEIISNIGNIFEDSSGLLIGNGSFEDDFREISSKDKKNADVIYDILDDQFSKLGDKLNIGASKFNHSKGYNAFLNTVLKHNTEGRYNEKNEEITTDKAIQDAVSYLANEYKKYSNVKMKEKEAEEEDTKTPAKKLPKKPAKKTPTAKKAPVKKEEEDLDVDIDTEEDESSLDPDSEEWELAQSDFLMDLIS